MKKKLLFLFFIAAYTYMSAQTIIFQENFNATTGTLAPKDWKITTKAKDGGWLSGTVTSLSSQYLPMVGNNTRVMATNEDKCNCDKSEDILATPVMNLKDNKTLFFALDVYFGGLEDQGVKENAYILSSIDKGANWEQVAEIEPTVSGENVVWARRVYDISKLAGNSEVMLAIMFTDNNGYLYGMGIDNVVVYEPVAIEGDFKVGNYKKYALKTDEAIVKGELTNYGASKITEVEMEYTVGNKKETKVIKGLDVAPLKSTTIEHPTAYKYSTTGAYNFDVKITKINGVADFDSTNNNGSFRTVAISKNEKRKVVYEEGTGTWCGFCPRGTIFMDSMAKAYPKDFIGIAVHNADPMTVTAYDAGLTKFPGFTGFPGVIVDRTSVIDPDEIFDVFEDAQAELNPFTINQSFTFDEVTRKMTVTLKTKANMTYTGKYRFNAVITEDGVKGTTAKYAQTNYYAGGQLGPMGGYETLPNPVPAAQMTYNHVARAILGGFAGLDKSIPANVVEGEEYTYTFNHTLAATVNPKNIHVIGMIIDNESGAIMNGVLQSYADRIVGSKDVFVNDEVNVYPNPMSDVANIEVKAENNENVSLTVINMMGQQVASRDYGKLNGEFVLPFVSSNFPNGIYTIHLKIGNKFASKQIVVQH